MAEQITKHVIVINDDVMQLGILCGLLKKEGFSVDQCRGAEEALRRMKGSPRTDLIVTDLYMPEMDGWRFCRLLRSLEFEAFNKIPILVVSATFAGEDAHQITRDLGANAFLSVPVDGRRFLSQVRMLLEGKTPVSMPKILIVEDSRTLAKLLKRVFESYGYNVSTALDGAEAKRRFLDEPFDIVILDYHLPDIQGDELLVDFRRRRQEAVFIMITTDPRPELALNWMKQGAAAYVRKPFEPEYLVRLCEKITRERALLHVEEILEARTRELRTSEERLQLALRGADLGMWDWNVATGEVVFNDRWAEILGYTPDEIKPHLSSWENLIHPDDKGHVMEVLNAHLEGKTISYVSQHRLRAKDGQWKWILDKGQVMEQDALGRPLRMVGTHLDITEQKTAEWNRLELERRIQQGQKMESLGVMAGGIAHHFNNLLMGILANLELARYDLSGKYGQPSGQSVLGYLAEAEKAGMKASELSHSILTYVGQGKQEKRIIDLLRLIKEITPLIQVSLPKKVTLQVDLPPNIPQVEADPNQVQQAITNIVTNAWEAIVDREGEIRLCLGTLHLDKRTLDLTSKKEAPPDGEYVFIEVSDTGCGIEKQTLEKVFDPFFSMKSTGRGLGLPVVMGIMRAHGGTVSISSEPGKGTTVRIFFPAILKQSR